MTFGQSASEFVDVYHAMFGDFEALQDRYDDFSIVEWSMFFLLTIFIPLVMLNLLIAVISDTHGKVTSDLDKTDNY